LSLTHFLLFNRISSKLFSGGSLRCHKYFLWPSKYFSRLFTPLHLLNLLVYDPLGLSALVCSHLYPFFKTLYTTCTSKVHNSVAFCIFTEWHHHQPHLSFEHYHPSKTKPSTYPPQPPKTQAIPNIPSLCLCISRTFSYKWNHTLCGLRV